MCDQETDVFQGRDNLPSYMKTLGRIHSSHKRWYFEISKEELEALIDYEQTFEHPRFDSTILEDLSVVFLILRYPSDPDDGPSDDLMKTFSMREVNGISFQRATLPLGGMPVWVGLIHHS